MEYYIVEVSQTTPGSDLSDVIERSLRNDPWFPADGSPGQIRQLTVDEVRALSRGLGG